MEGAILLSRALIDSEVFASEKLLKIWIWLLIKANFKERNVPIKIGAGQSVVTIKRGQLLFGRLSAENELFIDGSTIYKCIKKLESLGNILIESNSHYSVITICNYDYYQDINTYQVTANKQPRNKQVTTEEQPSNTPNKDNKDNKVIIYSEFYDSEIEKSKGKKYEANYLKLVQYLYGMDGGHKFQSVLKLRDQLLYDEFEKLMIAPKPPNGSIKKTIEAMENYKPLLKHSQTIYKTVLSYWEMDFKRIKK